MAKLLYQGHGSYRITANDGTVIYVDPFAGKGYDIPGNIILVTHQHGDHNQIGLVTQAKDCVIITNKEALAGNQYNNYSIKGIQITAVPAYNKNHKREDSVGYVIIADNIKIYASGDTSTTEAMKTLLPKLNLDYALLPIDGIYNMDAKEASVCAAMIGARYNIPIHMKPGQLFDRKFAENFNPQNRLIVEPGTEIELT
jgi:L-ascorbate metabolism protein UlaG (beta-lactamase superfamily)